MFALPRRFGSLALFAILALAAPPAQAQVCAPDGLTGPCCALATANIPAIPALQLDCRSICFNGCNVSQQFLDCVNLGALVPATSGGVTLCGVYDLRFRVKTCGTANFLWNGVLKAHYTRTWQEIPAVGANPLQVWRFVVNGDLLPTALLPTGPCRKPSCTSNYTRVYFSGHMDYAFDCASGVWSVAFAITHGCDGVHHQPGTVRPGVFHASRSFSIVGPGSTFVPAVTGPRSDGQVTGEGFRWNNWPASPACTFEEPAGGGFFATTESCFCTAGGPNQYISTMVDIRGACNSHAISNTPFGTYTQKRIGSWTAPGTFPGLEFALFDFGWLTYANGCTMVNTTEWVEGGETVGGFPAFDLAGAAILPEFEDLGTCNNSTTNPAPRIGGPHVSNYMIYLNLP
ncbi:MAG: hypothetical protein ACKVXR_07995 [Planctomycetota bacterium]